MRYPIAAACLVALSVSEIITFVDDESDWDTNGRDNRFEDGAIQFRNVYSTVTKEIVIPEGDFTSWDNYSYFHFEVDVASREGTEANDYYHI